MNYNQLADSGNGRLTFYSTVGLHQIMGTLGSDANSGFRGTIDIIQPNSSMATLVNHGIMHYGTNHSQKWEEDSGSAADSGSPSMTCFRLIIADGNGDGNNVTSTSAVNVYGIASIFGVKQ